MADPRIGILISSAMGAKALVNYLTMPLIIPNYTSTAFGGTLSKFAGVPIWPEKFSEKASAEIGKQLVIRSGGAERITDNYVPEPRVWTIDGYLRGVTFSLTSILATMQIPTKGSLLLSSVVNKATSVAMLQLQKNILENLRQSRTPFQFRTTNGGMMTALIADMQFDEKADIENAKAIHIVVEEYNALTLTDGVQASTISLSTPASGSIFGDATSVGVAAGISIVSTTGVYAAMVAMQGASLLSKEATYDTKTKKITEAKAPVREVNDESASFASVFNSVNPGDVMYYAELPSTVIAQTNPDGSVTFLDHFSVSISGVGGTLTLDVYKSADTKGWFVKETYVSGGETLFEGASRLSLNTLMRKTSEVYAIAYLVPTVPTAPLAPSTVVPKPDPNAYPAGKDDPAYILALAAYIENQTQWSTYDALQDTYSTALVKAFSTCRVVLIRRNS